MRQQYHFRNSERGLLAWDVLKLVEQAKNLPIESILLTKIEELDEEYWFEHAKPTVKSIADHAQLINQADLGYPIILCNQGRVMDGMHRVARAYLEGLKSINAVRFTKYIEPHFVGVEPHDLPY